MINISFARDQNEEGSTLKGTISSSSSGGACSFHPHHQHHSVPHSSSPPIIQIDDSDEDSSPFTSSSCSSSASNSTSSLTCCGHLGGCSEFEEPSLGGATSSTHEDHNKTLSSLFTRLGLSLSRKPSRECSFSQEDRLSPPSSFSPQCPSTTSASQSFNAASSSFPLLLAPSNKRKNSLMFSTPSTEDNESTVRDILSSISSRFHNALLEKKTSNSIMKPKKMKSNLKRFTKSFDGHSSSNY